MPSIYCLADVCMMPVGTERVSGSEFVVMIEKKIQASGLKSTLHSAGTTIEGHWDSVMSLIGELHEYAHEHGFLRIHSHIRIGSRSDKHQDAKNKVDVVLKKLNNDMNQS